jgi:hypothetical protein
MEGIINKIFITYSDGQYNALTRTYDPINPIILVDPLISESLVFDTNRRTIYAQGLEFGNSKTFAYMNSGKGLVGTDICKNTAYYITGITQDIDGSITYTYSYSYSLFSNLPSLFSHEIISGQNENHNDFYNQFNGYKVLSIDNEPLGIVHAIEPRYGNYVMTGSWLDPKDGTLCTAYYDASVTSGTAESNTVLTNIVGKKVITGITQSSYGQISYTYTYLNSINNDENVKFEKYTNGNIYIGGTTSANGNIIGYEFIDGTTYINNKQFYTDVSYVTQSYVGENNLTYFNPTGGFVSGKLTVTGHTTVTNNLTVSNTITATTANLTNMNTTYANVTERLRVSSGNEYLGSGPGAQCHLQYDNNEECINFIFD